MNHSEFSVQTRSEESGTKHFHTLAEALEEGERDRTMWRISFTLRTGEKVVLIAMDGPGAPNWTYDPIGVDLSKRGVTIESML